MNNLNNPIINSPIVGYAHHRIILDDTGKPFDFEFLEVNATFAKLTGLKSETLIGTTVRQAIPGIENSAFNWIAYYGDIALNGGEKEIDQYSEQLGKWYRVHVYSTERLTFTTMFMDITEQKRTEENLKFTSDLLSLFVEFSPIFAFIKEVTETESRVLFVSNNFIDMVGIPAKDMIGKTMKELFPPEFSEKITADDLSVVKNEKSLVLDEELNGKFYITYKFPVTRDKKRYIAGYTIDITERKAAEAERLQLQEQLAHSQKMDSVGRLAGGIAHDFNNMLAVIIGNTDIALSNCNPDDPIHHRLTEILKAATRSADLTRQMLAFARKQAITPRQIDINHSINDLLNMIKRLIGEDINLKWHPGSRVWPIWLDPSQLDQMLVNLCVNARDAIGGVGSITIVTNNTIINDTDCSLNKSFLPGEWVLISITDSGCGMNEETLSHLFEPFFTTKEIGRGTGLGLATVYGIVNQNNGFITVKSDIQQGTTFNIYLPRFVNTESIATEETMSPSIEKGCETILLVEDEAMILEITTAILTTLGYTVRSASSPQELLNQDSSFFEGVDLLLSDIIMPGMNGKDLAAALQKKYPALKVLMMSGYTAEIVDSHQCFAQGIHFIQKPFSIEALAVKVREALQ